jgi:hypothetical protein
MCVSAIATAHAFARRQSLIEREKLHEQRSLQAPARFALCFRHGRCGAQRGSGSSSRFTDDSCPNLEDKMTWIVIIALAIVAFGLVKARRHRNAAAGTGQQ